MKHSVIFKNQDNRWDNALPLGNGILGSMLFYQKGKLYMPINHYDVYYNIRTWVLPEKRRERIVLKDGGKEYHAEKRALADKNIPAPGESYCDYTYGEERSTVAHDNRTGDASFCNTFPRTGELVFSFHEALQNAKSQLTLYVEDAKTELILEKDGKRLQMDTIVACEDCIINKVTQTEEGLLQAVRMAFPDYRDDPVPPLVEFRQVSENTFLYTATVRFKDDLTADPFSYTGVVRLLGAEGQLSVEGKNGDILITKAQKEFHILTCICTPWNYEGTQDSAVCKTEQLVKKLDVMYAEHADRWAAFFGQSSIDIPDKFLEHIYYVNQYALGCCSGKDGVMRHQACGLNGLWDIRHPNLWASCWYWDVNIQAAFAGVFSSNRLDLGKVFSDGFLLYAPEMEKFAHNFHGMTGYAADHPYPFYYCVEPWCAQYLWFQYEYSQDKEYLRQEAYPLFLKVAEFLIQVFEYSQEDGYYHIYPDISPEQGPLAHDTTITVASSKYLLKFTLEAAKILEDREHDALLDKCRELLEKMPPYAISEEGNWGRHLKDSPDAPDNMWIRHPSMLMPLFPVAEFDLNSDPEMVKILSNTVDFLEERTEIGVFQGSWMAASAARLGRGQTCLRLLYERGIDHMLRSNGLTAEETERFINFCLVCRQPLYYPCMMEFTGEMLAAVNEMLLQSYNDLIRVFPALPDGDPEFGRMLRNGYAYETYPDHYAAYEAWKDVRFDKLLAKGAFEISAQAKGGKLAWICVHSQKGGKVNLTSPLLTEDMQVFCNGVAVEVCCNAGVLSFETQPGMDYIIAQQPEVQMQPVQEEGYPQQVWHRETYTKRNIYIGEDSEVQYRKSLDGFIRDWYLGNVRCANHTVYKFDFGTDDSKDYNESFWRQTLSAEERLELQLAPFLVKNLQFTVNQGYGFEDASKVTVVDRGAPDPLRRDFVQGSEDATFLVEVPRGQYELLVVSGDEKEPSVTKLDCVQGRRTGGEVIDAGHYQCKLIPLVMEEDGCIELNISTKPGYQWKLNYLFINAIKGY